MTQQVLDGFVVISRCRVAIGHGDGGTMLNGFAEAEDNTGSAVETLLMGTLMPSLWTSNALTPAVVLEVGVKEKSDWRPSAGVMAEVRLGPCCLRSDLRRCSCRCRCRCRGCRWRMV